MKGIRSTCYRCNQTWGNCQCALASPTKFIFNHTAIVDEGLDETGMFFVEPSIYYGQAYLNYMGEE